MKAMNDQEMVIRAQQGDLEAEESLMRKYKEIVKIKSRYYYMREQMKMMWSRKG